MPTTTLPSATAVMRYLIGGDGAPLGQGEADPSALGQGKEQAWQPVRLALDCPFDTAGLASVPPADNVLPLGLVGAKTAL